MPRLTLAACVLAVVPAISPAADRKASDSPGEAKPAYFSPPPSAAVKTAGFLTATHAPTPWAGVAMPPGYTYYGQRLQTQLWLDEHNCAPDGCPKPIGCGNAWTEKKFIFGSCRQFFGTAQSTVGHRYDTEVRHK